MQNKPVRGDQYLLLIMLRKKVVKKDAYKWLRMSLFY